MLKKIKSLFIEVDPNSKPNNPKEVEESDKNIQRNIVTDQPKLNIISEDFSNDNSSPDPKFIDILMKAIEANNMQGFDYLEYKNSLQSLAKMNMDEATRYNSAFVMANTMGLTKENLIHSINHYLKVIDNEEKKFKDALVNQRTRQIQGREDQYKNLELTIGQKQKQIEQLNLEIEKSKKELEGIKIELNESILKIDQTNHQFMKAHKMISQQIKDDLAKINSFIQ